jgi:hypothetical protein
MFNQKKRRIEQLEAELLAIDVAVEEAARARGVLIQGELRDAHIEGDVFLWKYASVMDSRARGQLRLSKGSHHCTITGNYFEPLLIEKESR